VQGLFKIVGIADKGAYVCQGFQALVFHKDYSNRQ